MDDDATENGAAENAPIVAATATGSSSTAPVTSISIPERRQRSGIKYPPYVNAYGSISRLFAEICSASVPPKFTQDFMESVLGLKSSSQRALIPLLKKLGFLDDANVPQEPYRLYRDRSQSGRVMAGQLRVAYADLYRAHEYAHTLSREDLMSKLRTLTGAGEDDQMISTVAGTFLELVKIADFSHESERQPAAPEPKETTTYVPSEPTARPGRSVHAPLGLSYTINLNLPATTEIEVFNAIFKSLKEHLLDGQ